jgi:hypothetical protein
MSTTVFSPFINFNEYMDMIPMISISNIRYNTVLEIYIGLKEYSNEELDAIPDSFVYIRMNIASYDVKRLSKALMLEEKIHKKALFSEKTDIKSQCELNMSYYKCLYDGLNAIRIKNVFIEITTSLETLTSDNTYIKFLKPLLDISLYDTSFGKCHYEFIYTKLSIIEECLFYNTLDSRAICSTEGEKDMMLYFNENISSFNIDSSKLIIHNKTPLNTPYECSVCSDSCTKYADCMYSNCRHMCLCYACSTQLDRININKCIICNQWNDCIIQVYSP